MGGMETLKASKRTEKLTYAIRDLVLLARKVEADGTRVIRLNIGDPNKYDFDTPQHMKDALAQAVAEGKNGYGESEGEIEFRKAVCEREKRTRGVDTDIDDVQVTSGVSEALLFLFGAILEPGDNVLLAGPIYPPYLSYAHFYQAEPREYRTIEEDGWKLDLDDIRKKIDNRTKALSVISPDNPTGAVYDKKVLRGICDIAGEYGVPIISDEIYDEMTYGAEFVSPVSVAEDVPIIQLNGLSKVYLVPGWRIGYAIFRSPRGELDEIKEAVMQQARIRLCPNHPAQVAGVAALRGPQNHIGEMNKKLKERGEYSYKRLNEIDGISTTMPQGAFYIFPKVELGSRWKDDKEFVVDVLNKAHVLFVHGSGFSPIYGKGHFRSVFLPPIDVLDEAYTALEKFMKG